MASFDIACPQTNLTGGLVSEECMCACMCCAIDTLSESFGNEWEGGGASEQGEWATPSPKCVWIDNITVRGHRSTNTTLCMSRYYRYRKLCIYTYALNLCKSMEFMAQKQTPKNALKKQQHAWVGVYLQWFFLLISWPDVCCLSMGQVKTEWNRLSLSRLTSQGSSSLLHMSDTWRCIIMLLKWSSWGRAVQPAERLREREREGEGGERET